MVREQTCKEQALVNVAKGTTECAGNKSSGRKRKEKTSGRNKQACSGCRTVRSLRSVVKLEEFLFLHPPPPLDFWDNVCKFGRLLHTILHTRIEQGLFFRWEGWALLSPHPTNTNQFCFLHCLMFTSCSNFNEYIV